MKKLLVIVLALAVGLVFASAVLAQETKTVPAQEEKALKVFNVYSDKKSPDNHYIPSGFMGDYGDISMDDQSMDNPHSGTTCIKFTYSAKRTQGKGWAGVYWQNPPNNWGAKQGGFNLTGLNKLTFWAKGAKAGEIIEKFMVGGIKGTYPDTAEVETGPIELSDEWEQYSINLTGKDLTYISGGFGWIAASDSNSGGATFYLDDIKFEQDTTLKPQVKTPQNMPFYVYADRTSLGNHYIPSGWMGDYGDIKLDQASTEDPYLGEHCIKIVYSGKCSQGARWVGIQWQHPANNWGQVDAGYDLSKATKLTFWGKGATGNERIEEFKIGGISGEYSDSDSAGIGPVLLTKDWKQYTIDLRGKDLSSIVGGFCWATNVDVNPEGAAFYLDEIKYE